MTTSRVKFEVESAAGFSRQTSYSNPCVRGFECPGVLGLSINPSPPRPHPSSSSSPSTPKSRNHLGNPLRWLRESVSPRYRILTVVPVRSPHLQFQCGRGSVQNGFPNANPPAQRFGIAVRVHRGHTHRERDCQNKFWNPVCTYFHLRFEERME